MEEESRELTAKGSELYAKTLIFSRGQIFLQKFVPECRNEAYPHVIIAEP
jgi:hypothetical protein